MSSYEDVFVSTPNGTRHHGQIQRGADGTVRFVRLVKEKDLMKIFDAWSINPQILQRLHDEFVQEIVFVPENNEDVYALRFDQFNWLYEDGKLIRKNYAGSGDTIYIPRKYFIRRELIEDT